jgi:predicted membrane-bound spermidine synthase
MGSISYYMIGLNSALPIFGKFLLVLVLFNLAAAGLCLCFATAFKNLSAANLLANLVILFSMLFGGFLLNKGKSSNLNLYLTETKDLRIIPLFCM